MYAGIHVLACLCVQINAMTLSSTFAFAVPEENLSHFIVDTEFYFLQKRLFIVFELVR